MGDRDPTPSRLDDEGVSGRVTFRRALVAQEREIMNTNTTPTTPTTTMRRAAILSATVLVALLASPLARADPDASMTPVVPTTAGNVQGEVIDGIYTFKGIPYAADTSGANRWAARKDPEPWSDVRNATTFMDICPQRVSNESFKAQEQDFLTSSGIQLPIWAFAPTADKPMSENCLGLNVYTPALDEKLPGMVWIHGGGLMSGAGSIYPPQAIVKTGDVIVVTINYRLGFLGYIAHPELSGTNFGLLDQIKALEWVRDNIESFGGDPSKVTIFGESAGGASVVALMASPLSEGLFQRVIAESASFPESPNVTVSEGGKLGVALGEQLGVPAGAGQLEKMREASFEELVLADVRMDTPEYNYNMPVLLYVDNTSLPLCLFCAFQEGSIHQVDLMIGTNNNETAMFNFVANITNPNTTDAYEQETEKQYGENAKEILSLFPGSPDSDAFATSELVGTAGQFGAPAFFAANKSSELGNPTFLYNFAGTAHTPVLDPLEGFHSLDVDYIFDNNGTTALWRDMQKYWTTFARTGNPNAESLPEWKAFEGADPSWMVLSDDKIGSEPVPEDMQAVYAVMNEFYPNWVMATNGGNNYFTTPSTSNE